MSEEFYFARNREYVGIVDYEAFNELLADQGANFRIGPPMARGWKTVLDPLIFAKPPTTAIGIYEPRQTPRAMNLSEALRLYKEKVGEDGSSRNRALDLIEREVERMLEGRFTS